MVSSINMFRDKLEWVVAAYILPSCASALYLVRTLLILNLTEEVCDDVKTRRLVV